MSEWFSDWFNEDYLLVYPHRNSDEAQGIIKLYEKYGQELKGKSVLDACCGLGRLSFLLAEKAASLTAFDLSPYFIAENKKKNSFKNLNFLELDIRDMKWENEFDAIFQIFTSFAYFESEKENLSVFDAIYRSLKKGGYYLFDFFNSHYVQENLNAHSVRKTEGIRIEEKRAIRKGRVEKEIQIFQAGQLRKYSESVALIDAETIRTYLLSLGFQLIQEFGSYNGELFHEENSARFILLLKK